MSSALLKLREQSRLFSTTEQEIAGHILDNPQLVVDMKSEIEKIREQVQNIE